MSLNEENTQLICKEHNLKITFIDIESQDLYKRTFCMNCKNSSDFLIDICQLPTFAEKYHTQAIQYKKMQNEEILTIKQQINQVKELFNVQLENINNLLFFIENITTPDMDLCKQENNSFSSLVQLEQYVKLVASQSQRTQEEALNDLKSETEALFDKFLRKFDKTNLSSITQIQKLFKLCNKFQDSVMPQPKQQIKEDSRLQTIIDENAIGEIQINCPQDSHFQKIVKFLDMSEKSHTRSLCEKCDLSNKKIKDLQKCYDKHIESFKLKKNEAEDEIQSFHKLICKSKQVINSILQYMIQQFEKNNNEIDRSFEEFKNQLSNQNQVFHIKNFDQLETFAREHYLLFYATHPKKMKISPQQLFHNQFYKLHKDLNRIKQQIESFFPQQIKFLEFHLDILKNQMKNNEIVEIESISIKQLQFADSLIQAEYNEVEKKLACSTLQKISFFDWITDVGNIGQIFQTSSKDTIEMICFQKQFEWFVTVQNSCHLIFWGQEICNGLTNYRIESNFIVSQIQLLKINESENSCYSFHKNKFTIWKKLNCWQKIKSIAIKNFFFAQFNSSFKTLILSESNDSRYLKFYSINGFNIQETISVEIPNFNKNEKLTDMYLFEQKENQYLLIIFEKQIYLLCLDNNKEQLILVEQLYLIFSKVIFNQLQNTLAIIDSDSNIINLYTITVQNNQRFAQFKQLKTRNQILHVWCSSSGEYLLVLTNCDLTKVCSIIKINKQVANQLNYPCTEQL